MAEKNDEKKTPAAAPDETPAEKPKKRPNHHAPNGKICVHVLARIHDESGSHNPGEVVGLSPESAAIVLKPRMTMEGVEVTAAEPALRLYMLKDAPHWSPKHNPPLKAKTIVGLPPAYGKALLQDGKAELCTEEHEQRVMDAQQAADDYVLDQQLRAQQGRRTAVTQPK